MTRMALRRFIGASACSRLHPLWSTRLLSSVRLLFTRARIHGGSTDGNSGTGSSGDRGGDSGSSGSAPGSASSSSSTSPSTKTASPEISEELLRTIQQKLDDTVASQPVKDMAARFQPWVLKRWRIQLDLYLLRRMHPRWADFDESEFLDGATAAFKFFNTHLTPQRYHELRDVTTPLVFRTVELGMKQFTEQFPDQPVLSVEPRVLGRYLSAVRFRLEDRSLYLRLHARFLATEVIMAAMNAPIVVTVRARELGFETLLRTPTAEMPPPDYRICHLG